MPIAQLLAAECAKCAHVEAAWVSPDERAFAIQGVVGRKSGPDPDHKGWTRIEPVYLGSEGVREINAIAARVRERHPQVHTAYVVSYVFRPGASWREVYRREARRAA